MEVIGIFTAICVGLVLYGLRCRKPLIYGLLEIAVAVVIITLTFYPQKSYLLLSEEPTWFGWLLSKAVGISTGVYVLVRGLDNVDKGLTAELRGRQWWDRVFRGRPMAPKTTANGGALSTAER